MILSEVSIYQGFLSLSVRKVDQSLFKPCCFLSGYSLHWALQILPGNSQHTREQLSLFWTKKLDDSKKALVTFLTSDKIIKVWANPILCIWEKISNTATQAPPVSASL